MGYSLRGHKELDTTEQLIHLYKHLGFPDDASGKESACQCKGQGFHPWMEKMPRRRKCQPTLVFLPGKSHGQRSLVSYNPWGCKRVEHNLATKQQNVIFPIFEKNFSYSPFSATDSFLCLPLLGKLLEGAVQTHTSLFPFLYTILVTHASQSLH